MGEVDRGAAQASIDAAAQADAAARRSKRDATAARLVRGGASVMDAAMYADLWLGYHEAAENIVEHGVIVQHPRTLNPIENPYLRRRDAAREKLQRMPWIRADWLWSGGVDAPEEEPAEQDPAEDEGEPWPE